jgi:hypothetical protein
MGIIMKKIKFSELLKQDNVAIHTPTEENAKALLTRLDELEYKWASKEKLTSNNYYYYFGKNTCYGYCKKDGGIKYGSLSVCEEDMKNRIIELADIDLEN